MQEHDSERKTYCRLPVVVKYRSSGSPRWPSSSGSNSGNDASSSTASAAAGQGATSQQFARSFAKAKSPSTPELRSSKTARNVSTETRARARVSVDTFRAVFEDLSSGVEGDFAFAKLLANCWDVAPWPAAADAVEEDASFPEFDPDDDGQRGLPEDRYFTTTGSRQ